MDFTGTGLDPANQMISNDTYENSFDNGSMAQSVNYTPAFDISSLGFDITPSSAYEDSYDAQMRSVSSTQKDISDNASLVDKALKFIKENETLSKFGLAAGAGMLRSMSQQQMLEDQRDWETKRAAIERKNRLKEARYAPHVATGLLAGNIERKTA